MKETRIETRISFDFTPIRALCEGGVEEHAGQGI